MQTVTRMNMNIFVHVNVVNCNMQIAYKTLFTLFTFQQIVNMNIKNCIITVNNIIVQ